MIYAELAGGLGNQMFIYAFARVPWACAATNPSPCWIARIGRTAPPPTLSAH